MGNCGRCRRILNDILRNHHIQRFQEKVWTLFPFVCGFPYLFFVVEFKLHLVFELQFILYNIFDFAIILLHVTYCYRCRRRRTHFFLFRLCIRVFRHRDNAYALTTPHILETHRNSILYNTQDGGATKLNMAFFFFSHSVSSSSSFSFFVYRVRLVRFFEMSVLNKHIHNRKHVDIGVYTCASGHTTTEAMSEKDGTIAVPYKNQHETRIETHIAYFPCLLQHIDGPTEAFTQLRVSTQSHLLYKRSLTPT